MSSKNISQRQNQVIPRPSGSFPDCLLRIRSPLRKFVTLRICLCLHAYVSGGLRMQHEIDLRRG
jgi:hypothetical protein